MLKIFLIGFGGVRNLSVLNFILKNNFFGSIIFNVQIFSIIFQSGLIAIILERALETLKFLRLRNFESV